MLQGGVEPGTLRSEGQCVDHWATLPLHRIWQKILEYIFQCKMRKSQFSQQDVSWFNKLWWFWIWFCMRHKWLLQSFNGAFFLHFFLSYLSWMSADWKNKCWFTINNGCFIYDSNIYFGALIWFFAPSPASTYRIEHLPFSIEDVSQF